MSTTTNRLADKTAIVRRGAVAVGRACPEAIAVVVECREAGTRVKMITGDPRGIPAAIGAQIAVSDFLRVLT